MVRSSAVVSQKKDLWCRLNNSNVTVVATCVRRELRELTPDDRAALLDAMRVFLGELGTRRDGYFLVVAPPPDDSLRATHCIPPL